MDRQLIKKGAGFSPLWILPLVALCIGGWLLYTSYRDAGIACAIHFANAEGITPGKTQVMYRGVPVGLVRAITVDEDLQGVNLQVMMEKKARRSLVQDTKFWVVRPQISAGNVTGLETLLSGSYIAIQPGTSTEEASNFTGLADAPPLPSDSPGLHITLRTDSLNSLQQGAPVYTRSLKIGRINNYQLAPDNSILIDLFIEPQYSHLIQKDTRFWNSSGLAVEGSLQTGFSMRVQSMASLIYGGISCGTPEPLRAASPPAVNGMVFPLHDNYEDAEYGLPLTLQLSSGGGIVEGKTRLMYRGLEAGVVKAIRISDDKERTVIADILLDPRAEAILKEGTRFWVARPEVSLDGIRNLDTIIAGPYITFQPGNGAFRDHFQVEEGEMPRAAQRPGRHYTLTSKDSSSLEAGAPLLYKNMVVGEIRDVTFTPDARAIHTDILVYEEYTRLIRKDTVFWNVSGIQVDANLSRVNVNVASLKSMLLGGIAFVTPETKRGGKVEPAPEGATFPLFASLTAATREVPALRPDGLVLSLHASGDNSLEIGAPVLYKNIPVGEVTGYRLSADHQGLEYDILIHARYADLITTSSRFYHFSGVKIDASLAGLEVQAGTIASIVNGGIAFFNPAAGEPAQKVQQTRSFPLHADFAAARFADGVTLTLRLARADGLRDKTPVRFQGLEIGALRNLRFAPGMNGLLAEALVSREAATLFRDKTRLWVVRPELAITGIQHVETAITGPYIDVVPGDGKARTDFSVTAEEPGQTPAGLNIILETPRLGSLKRNSPVTYRQVRVGRVTGFTLSPTAQQVWVLANIEPAYAHLVRGGSKFWLASGISASWGLLAGLKVDTESVAAVLDGGIAFATPEGEQTGAEARAGDHFPVHDRSDEAWLQWRPKLAPADNESTVDNPAPAR